MEYTYQDDYKGKARTLLIFSPNEGDSYRVFCEASFLGSITPVWVDDNVKIWKTEYNILKPIVRQMGAYIESFL
jgi:hypothetical protein